VNIKVLDNEIRSQIHTIKLKNVRRYIKPGSTQSWWKAVKIARDVIVNTLPSQMYENG
jgi:hypothetical protein